MAKLSEFYSDALPIPESLWAMLDDGANKYPDNVAVTAMHQPVDYLTHLKPDPSNHKSDRCLQWTFSELRHASLLLASAFQQRGVKRGTTLVTLINNGVECVLLLWVSTILQLTLAPLVPSLLDEGREEQLRDYLQRLKPDAVVVPDEKGGVKIDESMVLEGLRATLKLSLSKTEGNGWNEIGGVVPDGTELSDEDVKALAQDPAVDRGGERIGGIYFTSGTTTGKPKGCPHSVSNLLSMTAGMFAIPDIPNCAIIHTPNSGGIAQAFLHAFGMTGRHAIFPGPAFSPVSALDAIEQHGAELMVCIPVMSRMFEAAIAAQKRDLSALKQVGLGGDIPTVDAKAKFEQLFPSAKVIVGHGMTEGVSVIGFRDQGYPDPFPHFHGMLATGYPQDGTLLRICDEEGKVLSRGESGELHLGGHKVIDHYLENAQPEAFYRDDKGSWMLTGDRAIMNDDGIVFIIGRKKDVIKRVGLQLSPTVVESVLNGIKGVEASVIGAPHVDYGEVPVAVVKDPALTTDSSEIRKIVKDRLGADYALENVVALADLGLESWPLNATGKIAKHELKSAYAYKFGGR